MRARWKSLILAWMGVLLLASGQTFAVEVVINEFMAINATTLTNNIPATDDWIELYNTTAGDIDLTGWHLTDNSGNLTKWTFPSTTISNFSYLLVYASKYTNSMHMGELHANFSLDGDGEYLALVDPDTNIVHEFAPRFTNQTADVSYGLKPATLDTNLLSAGAACKWLVPDDGSDGTNWVSHTGFNDVPWTDGNSGVGYETNTTNYTPLIQSTLPIGTTGAYVRIPFTVSGGLQVDSLVLQMKYDDGFVAYLNGKKVAQAAAPADPQWDSVSTSPRANTQAVEYVDYDISLYTNLLITGGNMLAIHMLNWDANPLNSDLIAVPQLVAGTLSAGSSSELRYFHTPTPGAQNVIGLLDILEDVKFSKKSGYYYEPFELALSCESPDSIIMYTLDYTTPYVTNGITYSGPITIASNSIVRARAFRGGYEPSELEGRSFLYTRDIIKGQYMSGVTVALYRDKMTNAFQSLPTMSIITDWGNMLGTSYSIYDNSMEEGVDWERPVTLEWINPDGSDGFSVNCGVRMYGGYGRRQGDTAQKSFRFLFKTAYGPGSLDYPIFTGEGATRGLNTFICRAGYNDQFRYNGLIDPYVRRMQLDISGGEASRSAFVHLFIDGEYWGIYNPSERADQAYGAQHHGGEKENWDALNAGYVIGSSTMATYDAMRNVANNIPSTPSKFEELAGLMPTGRPKTNDDAIVHLNIDNNIDYIMSHMWAETDDWPWHNWYANGARIDSEGWRYYCWDAEWSLASLNDNKTGTAGPHGVHGWLATHPEYRRWFGDRVHNNFHNDGPMESQQCYDRYNGMLEEVEPAIYAHFGRRSGSITTWMSTQNGKLNYMNLRPSIFFDQLIVAGWYPEIGAPVFSQRGGVFTNGFTVTLTTTNDIYFTLDGTDPRGYGSNTINGLLYTNPISLTDSTIVKARALTHSPTPYTWSALEEAFFWPEDRFNLRITEVMYNPRRPGTNETFMRQDYEYVEIRNASPAPINMEHVRFTDGINFAFSNLVLDAGEYAVVVANPAAFSNRYDTASILIAGHYEGSLTDGGERLRLKTGRGGAAVSSFAYNDSRNWPLAADGAGHSLVPALATTQTNQLFDCGANWRASTLLDGSPGIGDPALVPDVILNEITAHTDYTNAAKPEYDSNDWIEMFNVSGSPVSLADWYLSDDPDELDQWAIPASSNIAAGGWISFDEVSGFHSPIDSGFGINKAGEEIYLSYLPGDGTDRIADCISFKGQENGASLGRYTDGENYWHTLAPTRDDANGAPSNHLIISEIMYHPAPTLDHPEDNVMDEYIEIYNPANRAFDLWNESGAWRISGGIEFDFPTNLTLAAKDDLLIVQFSPLWVDKRDSFLASYGLTNGQVTLLGPYRGRLSNEGERIAIERPQAPDLPGDKVSWVIVDEAIYFDQAPWPSGSDASGKPIQRVSPSEHGNDPDNWSDVFAASPGGSRAKIGITSPRTGAGMFLPLTVDAQANVDADQVQGTIQQVEFFEGENSLGIDTEAPYSIPLSSITAPGTYVLTAAVTDSGGTVTSSEIAIYTLAINNDAGATGMTDMSASMHGSLAAGAGMAAVSVYWGETDGGTDKALWDNSEPMGNLDSGSFTAFVDSLKANTRYFYRAHGENAGDEGWALTSQTFMTQSFGSWSNKLKITFSGYDRPETLYEFPALVILSTNIPGFSYDDFANSDATDLRFGDATGLIGYDYEIEQWNTNGESYVWVRVPSVYGSSSHVFAYWNNVAAIFKSPRTYDGSAWDDSYKLVWHWSDGYFDSTANNREADNFNAVTVPGLIGDAQQFASSTSWVDPKIYKTWYQENINHLTVNLWCKPESTNEIGSPFGAHTLGVHRLQNRFHMLQVSNLWEFGINKNSEQELVCDEGEWQMMTMVLSNNWAFLYKNAVAAPTAMAYTNYYTPDLSPAIGYLGEHSNDVFYFEGDIDEIRFSHVARSPDWIWACWMNMASNDSFISYGSVTNNEPSPDADGDGMLDAWEIAFFGSVNAPLGGTNEDWDGDGFINLYEYGAGTSPTNALQSLDVRIVSPGGGPMVIRYDTLTTTGGWYSGLTRYYDLEDSSNLTSDGWLPVIDQTNITGDGTVEYTNPPALDIRYFRVKARLR